MVGPPEALDPSAVFGALFQYPGTFGDIRDFTDAISALHAAKMITQRRDEVTRLPQRGSSFRYSTFRASRITPTITSPTDFRVSAASLSMVSSTVCHGR